MNSVDVRSATSNLQSDGSGEYWAAVKAGTPTIHLRLFDNEVIFWLEGWPETIAQLMSPDEARAHLQSSLTWYALGGYHISQWCPWALPISAEPMLP